MKEDWVANALDELTKSAMNYETLALLQETKKLIEKQQLRIKLKQGELEAKLWNPSDW